MDRKTQGAILMILSAMSFALMQIVIAKTAERIPLFEQLFFRNLFAAMIAYVGLRKKRLFPLGDRNNRMLLFLRSAAGYLGMVALFYATAHGSQGDVSIINKMSPFIVLLLAALFLREKIAGYQIAGLLLAFLGAAFVLNPQFNSNWFPLAVAFVAAVFSGIAYTIVSALKGREDPMVIIFFFSAFSTVVTCPVMLAHFVAPSVADFLLLILIGVFAAGGQVLLTYSYAFAKASEVSIFNYSGILFSMLFGAMFLGQPVKSTSALGAALVILAGLIVFIGNQKRND